MKLVHVVDTSSRLAGGMFESVKGLARAGLAHGDDVSVIAGRDQWTDVDLPSWEPLAVDAVPSAGLTDGIMGTAMRDALAVTAPSLVHLHGIWGVGARATAAWARRTGEPFVIAPRGMLDRWARGRSWLKKRVSQFVWEGWLLDNARFLHALNREEADSIAEAGWRRPVVVIPNGVVMPDIATRLLLRATPERPTLLYIGRLHPKKGLEELLHGWAALPAALRENWQLKIAGWDEVGLLAKLMSQAHALGLEDSVEFVGPLFGEEKDRMLRSAAAFILPSYSEGLPMAVLEAWAYRLPVFMTRACNLPKGFDLGAAFEIGTQPADITPVLAATLDDDVALRRAGENGRSLVERDHSWEAIARDMRTAYGEAM
jgi:poly(glycerol-phosphate) alpha-glucosyltransferase